MKHFALKLALVVIFALVLRVALLAFVNFPGIADPNHYYNMAVRLINGHGFTIDYIWQYNIPPEAIVHPEEHWMPLAAVMAAVPMALFGESPRIALILFIVLGACLPLVGAWAGKQFGLDERARLFTALACAVVPEFVLNSVRTDTTIPAMLFTCVAILAFVEGWQSARLRWYLLCGVMIGLTYLTRNDGLLLIPMVIVTAITYSLFLRERRLALWRGVAVVVITAGLVMLPWMLRNLNEMGMIGSPETGDMFFFTDNMDHYAFGQTFTLQTMLERQTFGQMVGKRLFELAAAAKLTFTTIDMIAFPMFGGVLLLLWRWREEKQRWIILAPTLILLFGIFVAYPILIPYKSQAGSFKKAYLMLLPMLIPFAGYAFNKVIEDVRYRTGAMLVICGFVGLNAFELVRADATFALNYLRTVEQMADVAETLPDRNGDGQIILMAQDPYIIRYAGIQSIMYPSEPRDVVIEVAQRYHVDYLLMPPGRVALDAIYIGDDDPRFELVERVRGTNFEFYSYAESP